MTVGRLISILHGLPESSKIRFVRKGELLNVTIVGVTRTQKLPDPNDPHANRKFHEINESIILTDEPALDFISQDIEVKKVWKAIEGKFGV